VNAVNAEVSTDFYEGCRAVLVDKDNTPKVHPFCFVVCVKIRHYLPQAMIQLQSLVRHCMVDGIIMMSSGLNHVP
jgi:hypothetical protein